MRNILFFFAALAMSAPAAGHEPADVVIRVENPAVTSTPNPCTVNPCIPATVEPIRLVPAGTSNPATQPAPNPNPAPKPEVKSEGGGPSPWWMLLALLPVGWWFNRQHEQRDQRAAEERERRARDAANQASAEARERREDRAAEEREREREHLLKAAAIAAWEREHGLMNDAERRAFETRWALASHDRQIQSAPARLDVLVDSVSAIVRPAEILGGRRVERRVVQTETPATTTPPAPPADPAPTATPPVNAPVTITPPAPQPARPDDQRRDNQPLPEGQIRLSRRALNALADLLERLGVTEPAAVGARIRQLLGLTDLTTGQGLPKERMDQAFAELEGRIEALRQQRQQAAGARGGNGGGGGAAPAPTTEPAGDKPKGKPTVIGDPSLPISGDASEPTAVTADTAAPAAATGKGAEEPKSA